MTVYIGGVKVAPIQKTYSRIYFIEELLGWLYHDLRQFKAEIEVEHAKSAVKKPLQLLINKYCQEILRCADDYPTAVWRRAIGSSMATNHLRFAPKTLIVFYHRTFPPWKKGARSPKNFSPPIGNPKARANLANQEQRTRPGKNCRPSGCIHQTPPNGS